MNRYIAAGIWTLLGACSAYAAVMYPTAPASALAGIVCIVCLIAMIGFMMNPQRQLPWVDEDAYCDYPFVLREMYRDE